MLNVFSWEGAVDRRVPQIYHTKLEQLTTLTNKLNSLSHTLGPEFYPPDITEPALASGEDSGNSTANRDVTPERFSKLEKELVRGKGEVVSLVVSSRLLHIAKSLSYHRVNDRPSFQICWCRLTFCIPNWG